MAKDSAGSGSAWATGTTSQRTGMTGYPVESRLMFEGTVTGTDMSRATDAREKDRIGILGTGLSYAGSYGRVTSESIGRDLNPLGRGSGQALVGGDLEFEGILVRLPNTTSPSGDGNSVNNKTTPPGSEYVETPGGNAYNSKCISDWADGWMNDDWNSCWNCPVACACSGKDDQQCTGKQWQTKPAQCVDRYCNCKEKCPGQRSGCCYGGERVGSGKACCPSGCLKCGSTLDDSGCPCKVTTVKAAEDDYKACMKVHTKGLYDELEKCCWLLDATTKLAFIGAILAIIAGGGILTPAIIIGLLIAIVGTALVFVGCIWSAYNAWKKGKGTCCTTAQNRIAANCDADPIERCKCLRVCKGFGNC